MKLDAKKLAALDVPDQIRAALAGKKPVDWALSLRGLPAAELKVAVRAIGECALDKPVVRKASKLAVNKPFVHHGDLVVRGNLRVAAPFFVTGDVRVIGVMMDCGPDSSVAIGGDLYVKHLHTDGEFACGNIEAPDGIVYGYYNDNTLDCLRIRARVVIADEHDIQPSQVKAAIDYSDLSDYRQGYGEGVYKKLSRVFIDEVFEDRDDDSDDEGVTLDHHKLFDRLWKGKPVFRAAARSKSRTKSKRR